MSTSNPQLTVDRKLYERLEARVELVEFDDIDEYVEYLLEELVYRIEESDDRDAGELIDESAVRDQLQALGYLRE